MFCCYGGFLTVTVHIAIYAPLRGTHPTRAVAESSVASPSQALHHRVKRCIAPAESEGGLLGVDDEHCLLPTAYCGLLATHSKSECRLRVDDETELDIRFGGSVPSHIHRLRRRRDELRMGMGMGCG